MASTSLLQEEFLTLDAMHRRLVQERAALISTGADGAAFQDHAHRMRVYLKAHELYVTKLEKRRQERAKQA